MYKCQYCGKSFKKENTLAVHVRAKRRFMQKDEKHVQIDLEHTNYFTKLEQIQRMKRVMKTLQKPILY